MSASLPGALSEFRLLLALAISQLVSCSIFSSEDGRDPQIMLLFPPARLLLRPRLPPLQFYLLLPPFHQRCAACSCGEGFARSRASRAFCFMTSAFFRQYARLCARRFSLRASLVRYSSRLISSRSSAVYVALQIPSGAPPPIVCAEHVQAHRVPSVALRRARESAGAHLLRARGPVRATLCPPVRGSFSVRYLPESPGEGS